MKRILFLVLCIACSSEEPGPTIGCSIGVRGGKVHLLECSTKENFLQGSRHLPYWNNYTQHKWVAAKNCQECYDKYQ